MATLLVDGLQAEAPPSKRARIEGPDEQTQILVDDMDDSYSTAGNTPSANFTHTTHIQSAVPAPIEQQNALPPGIPGLGLLGQPSKPLVTSQTEASEIQAPKIQTSDAQIPEDLVAIEQIPEDGESPSVTTALEAMLGGLDPSPVAESPLPLHAGSKDQNGVQGKVAEASLDSRILNGILGEDKNGSTPVAEQIAARSPPALQLIERTDQGETLDVNTENINPDEAEFEIDSSPIQSSDESDSDDSSSSEDSDEDVLLNPEEQARILMQVDDDDDEFGKGDNTGAPLRTKNEVPENIIPKPNVTITPEMKIEELGAVEGIVESILLIKAKTSGEYRVLESGSVLCLADRSVIGVVSETLGRVQQPLYSVMFTNAQEIAQAGLTVGTKIYYSEQHSTFVFTQAIKAYKGSDASNLHDEEVGDEEMEFSDDEKEAEHRKRIKQRKEERKNRRQQQNGGGNRGPHPLQQQQAAYDPVVGLNYEDDDEGPYKPLARPAGFANTFDRREAPQEGTRYGEDRRNSRSDNSASNGRGRGRTDRSRGRGDQGRSNERGPGRGGFQDRRRDGYSQPPQDIRNNGYAQPPQGLSMGSNLGGSGYNYTPVPQEGYNPQQPHFSPPYSHLQYPQQSAYQQPPAYPTIATPAGWSNMPQPPPPPMPSAGGGAYLNPAFFGSPPQVPGQQWYSPAVHQPQRNPEAERAFQEAQDRLNILKSLSGGRGNGQ